MARDSKPMLYIGKTNQLTVLEVGAYRAVLDGGNWGRLLLPLSECHDNIEPGDQLEAFIYLDAEGDPVPTTRSPAGELGQVVWLEIVEVNTLGAFADWGLPKDLFIPYAEQHTKLRIGSHALVKIYQDNQGRIAGTTRLDHWIKDNPEVFKHKEKVSLVIADKTELGFKAVINHEYWGLLYGNELYRRVRKGLVIDGYIKRVREDGKIDLTLDQPGYSKEKLDAISTSILAALEENDGFLALTDKSDPSEIYATFNVSKKVFKQAVGALYKQRLIVLEQNGIRKA